MLLVFLLVLARVACLHLLGTLNGLTLVEGAIDGRSDVLVPLFGVIAPLKRVVKFRAGLVPRVHHARLVVE